MDDLPTALRTFLQDKRLLAKELGEMLTPVAKPSQISNWMSGLAKPKPGHRGQLVNIAKGYVKPQHFL